MDHSDDRLIRLPDDVAAGRLGPAAPDGQEPAGTLAQPERLDHRRALAVLVERPAHPAVAELPPQARQAARLVLRPEPSQKAPARR
jgi:hypothetical protein